MTISPDTATAIQLLALDVDGVMTDGRIVYSSDGQESKAFHIKDGLGIKLLQKAGIEVAIITGRASEMVARRARELGITTVLQGREDKHKALSALADERQLDARQIAYMGDDLPDLAAIQWAGLGACPRDACIQVLAVADYESAYDGGQGCVREFAEALLAARDQLSEAVARYQL